MSDLTCLAYEDCGAGENSSPLRRPLAPSDVEALWPLGFNEVADLEKTAHLKCSYPITHRAVELGIAELTTVILL